MTIAKRPMPINELIRNVDFVVIFLDYRIIHAGPTAALSRRSCLDLDHRRASAAASRNRPSSRDTQGDVHGFYS